MKSHEGVMPLFIKHKAGLTKRDFFFRFTFLY